MKFIVKMFLYAFDEKVIKPTTSKDFLWFKIVARAGRS